jgi:hypothetical protein
VPAAASGRYGPDQRGIEQQLAHLGEDGFQWLGHALHSAAPQSLISNPGIVG